MKAIALVALLVACGAPSRRPGNGGGPDAGSSSPDAAGPTGDSGPPGTTYVYAHTADTLYQVDPDTLAITMVGAFGWPASVGTDQMTDIAIDKTGQMTGVSFTRVYRIDPSTAQTTLLSPNLAGSFNGLSFVPAASVGATGDDVLVGTRNTDGKVFRVDPMTGATTQVGDMGGGYVSSGDMVAIDGFGTVQTVPGANGDQLVRLASGTFAATPIGNGTGYTDIWGVAYWKGKVYGFTDTGQFVLIDPMSGGATLVSTNAVAWWGAAVTTTAPVIGRTSP